MAAHLEPAPSNLNGGQRLAIKYFVLAMVLFGAQLLFGMLASIQYLAPRFLFGVMDFSINRMVHINAMVIWMLCGFIGAVYWMLQEEAGHEHGRQHEEQHDHRGMDGDVKPRCVTGDATQLVATQVQAQQREREERDDGSANDGHDGRLHR